jgi:hypothetical protein
VDLFDDPTMHFEWKRFVFHYSFKSTNSDGQKPACLLFNINRVRAATNNSEEVKHDQVLILKNIFHFVIRAAG